MDITEKELKSINFSVIAPCYKQYEELETYYHPGNSSVWQMFETSPKWVYNLAAKVPNIFKHHVVSVVKIDPGNTIPRHIDRYYKIKEAYGDGDICRFLIFLEDWKRGHYFELEDQPFVKWKRGDWVSFGTNDWHLAGNMGDSSLYCAQVTGILN